MLVTHAADIVGTEFHAQGPGWESLRLLTRRDGAGYSVHETRVRAGAELKLHYKHHIEANYCFEGEGEVVNLANGELHSIRPGTLYTLDRHDPHILRATKGDLRLVCVFNPPLSGRETHDADGSYLPELD